jgi:hypothetical protein
MFGLVALLPVVPLVLSQLQQYGAGIEEWVYEAQVREAVRVHEPEQEACWLAEQARQSERQQDFGHGWVNSPSTRSR